MPAYIPITEAETDPEAPLTSELAKKWRDNLEAIIDADPTAIAAGKFLKTAIFYRPSAGNVVCARGRGVSSLNTTPVSGLDSFKVVVASGTIRVNVSFTPGGAGGGSWNVTRNGTIVASGATNGTFSTDISVSFGDLITYSVTGTSTGTGTINSITVSADIATMVVA